MNDFDAALAQLTGAAPPEDAGEPLFPTLPENWTDPNVTPLKPRDGLADMDRSDRLEHLIDKSLDKADEILDLPIDPSDDSFVKVAAMQKDLVVSLVNAGIKIDDNRFRKKSTEALTSILAQVLQHEKNLAAVPGLVLEQAPPAP